MSETSNSTQVDGQVHAHASEDAPQTVFKPDILLIDVSGLAYAAMYTPIGKLEFNGMSTGAIHGALNSIFTRMAARPDAVPVVLWDARAEWRYGLLPEYKESRSGEVDSEKRRLRESVRAQVPHIQLLLSIMGIPQIRCAGAEADDLSGVLCRHLDPSWSIELTTRDTDWWQGLDARTVWYSPVHRKGLTLAGLSDPENDMKDGHFLTTDEYLEAKALAGDSSDEIPGIDGVGLATAVKIIRKHGVSICDFWSKVDAGTVKPKGVIEERVADVATRAVFARNLKLMDWRLAPKLDLSLLAFTAGECDFDALEDQAAEYGLKKVPSTARTALKRWKAGWGAAVAAIDSAMHGELCLPVINPKKNAIPDHDQQSSAPQATAPVLTIETETSTHDTAIPAGLYHSSGILKEPLAASESLDSGAAIDSPIQEMDASENTAHAGPDETSVTDMNGVTNEAAFSELLPGEQGALF